MARAFFEACQRYSHDDGKIIAKTASVIRKQLFNKDEIVTGDLPMQRQIISVPQVLHHLIQFLLGGALIKIVHKKCNLCKAKVEMMEKNFIKFSSLEIWSIISLSMLVKY